jgi:hypothetical protein
MKNFISLETIIAGEFTHQTSDSWRKSVSDFKKTIGRYIYDNNKEHQFTKRIDGFKNNSDLIFNFIKSEDNLSKFVDSLSSKDKSKLVTLGKLKSTHVEIYDQINKRYKTEDEVIDDLYHTCGSIELSILGNKILESNLNTKCHTVDLDGDPDATCICCSPRTETVRELKLVVNDKEVLITDDEGVLFDKWTTKDEITDIVIELINMIK